jgi:hypothetical protein
MKKPTRAQFTSAWEKHVGAKSAVGKAANVVARASGGGGIIDYAGGKASLKDAGKSALYVGANLSTLAVGGAALRGLKGASQIAKAGPKVKHWTNYKGPGKVHGGRGNTVGRSGTSYKPYR